MVITFKLGGDKRDRTADLLNAITLNEFYLFSSVYLQLQKQSY